MFGCDGDAQTPPASRFDHFMPDSVTDEFAEGGEAELVHDFRPMVFDGPLAYPEHTGNLLVRFSLREKLQDLGFPGSQRVGAAAFCRVASSTGRDVACDRGEVTSMIAQRLHRRN